MNFHQEYINKLNEYEENIKPDFNIFIKSLNTYGIIHDTDVYNIIFYRENESKPFCISSKEIIFRVSGMCAGKNNKDEIKFLTNKEFYDYYIKLILYLKNK